MLKNRLIVLVFIALIFSCAKKVIKKDLKPISITYIYEPGFQYKKYNRICIEENKEKLKNTSVESNLINFMKTQNTYKISWGRTVYCHLYLRIKKGNIFDAQREVHTRIDKVFLVHSKTYQTLLRFQVESKMKQDNNSVELDFNQRSANKIKAILLPRKEKKQVFVKQKRIKINQLSMSHGVLTIQSQRVISHINENEADIYKEMTRQNREFIKNELIIPINYLLNLYLNHKKRFIIFLMIFL
mgnify:CR=1 FL=1